jgi:hypothetical protein
MSYQHFNVRKIIDVLGYRVRDQQFINQERLEEPSADLRSALRLLGSAVVFSSEKARSEAVVAPVLSEVANKTQTRLFSGETFDVDSDQGLSGVVDFMFARSAPGKTVVDPVLCLVEAKKADIDSNALGQCMAEMIAAQRFNRQKGPIYGCVTTGYEWQFLRLNDDLIEIDPQIYFEDRLPTILGIFVWLLGAA